MVTLQLQQLVLINDIAATVHWHCYNSCITLQLHRTDTKPLLTMTKQSQQHTDRSKQ